MSDAEKREFLQQVEADSSLKEELEGEKLMRDAAIWQKQQELKANMAKWKQETASKPGTNVRMIVFAIAAVGLLLVTAIFLIRPQHDMNQLVAEYYTIEDGTRNGNNSNENLIISAAREVVVTESVDFYENAATKLKELLNQNPNDAEAIYWIGHIYFLQSNYEMAARNFEKIANEKSIIGQRAMWYLALANMKLEKEDEATSMLEAISKNEVHPYRDKSKKILKKIK